MGEREGELAAGGAVDAQPREQLYRDIHASPEFQMLRKKYRAFVLPATLVFLGWYLLYVVLSNWASGFMSIKLVGNINVALLFGLLQFLSTFAIAWLYARYANRQIDPIAARIERRYDEATGR